MNKLLDALAYFTLTIFSLIMLAVFGLIIDSFYDAVVNGKWLDFAIVLLTIFALATPIAFIRIITRTDR